MAQIKIAIVEDEPLFRGLLENHLRRHPRLEVALLTGWPEEIVELDQCAPRLKQPV